jgi:hypothetical protein
MARPSNIPDDDDIYSSFNFKGFDNTDEDTREVLEDDLLDHEMAVEEPELWDDICGDADNNNDDDD